MECTNTNKTYTYDSNGNQISETSSGGTQTIYTYDAANRLKTATGKTGETVDYIQTNRYNGYGQRVEKSETVGTTTNTTNYFYDGSQILYTTDGSSNVTSFNMVGAEDNIILTGRPGDTADADPSFYVYTKDIRESTTNVIGTDGTAAVSYSYDTFGETTEYQQDEADPFYNEICYTAGVYDKTTGLYNLSARYYDPADGTFLTQDTYRGSRSRTATLNYYAYCAGNPVSYTDPSGHAFWAVAGAAMGAYDGYQYAKKKNLKGWKKGAAIVGGALLGAVNPFKVVGKAVKVAKAVKTVTTAKKATKTTKALKAVTKTPKKTVVTKKVTKVATAGNKTVKTTGVVKAQAKQIKNSAENFTVKSDNVTYRRVQGGSGTKSSQARIAVNDDGTISIANKSAQLNVSIDDGAHSNYYLQKRGADAVIVEFEVPRWFDDFLQQNTIPQYGYKTNPLNQGRTAPKLTDPSSPGKSYELPAPWVSWLEEYATNARVISP